MKYLLCHPYPDEPLGSVWVRTVRQTSTQIALATKAVTGGYKFSPSLFHLGYLRTIASALQMPPRELLWNHTVFPYATAFYPSELLNRSVESALAVGTEARGIASVMQSVSDYSRLRRFCPFCARDELERFGETYWHRAHNLPGVLACSTHGVLLQVTSIPTVSLRWRSELPQDLLAAPNAKRPSAFEARVAELSMDFLSRPVQPANERGTSWYRNALYAKGLATPGRQIEADKLARWFSEHAPKLASLGLSKRDQSLRWLSHMVRPGTNQPFVTVKHVLFEAALELQEPLAAPALNYVPLGFQGFASPEADARFARQVRALTRKYIALGERVRVKDVLEEAGCWTRFRHNVRAYPAVRSAVAALKASAVAVRPNWGKGLGSSNTEHAAANRRREDEPEKD